MYLIEDYGYDDSLMSSSRAGVTPERERRNETLTQLPMGAKVVIYDHKDKMHHRRPDNGELAKKIFFLL